jgi:NAD(P)-dependent dehydrogenase (short-subunit alcohol dehydrogenase family)
MTDATSERRDEHQRWTERFGLTDRVALITGAGSGMGRASAITFAQAGAHVIVVDRDAAAATAVVSEINGSNGSAEPAVLDATDQVAIAQMFNTVERDHGRVDVLFNHAGRACAPGLEVTEADWEAAIELNLKAPILITSAALPLLRRSKHASLIYTASIAGLVASPMSPLYSAAKGGLVLYVKSVAATLGPEGIRANVICPGSIETPMLIDFFSSAAPAHSSGPLTRADVAVGVDRYAQLVPLGRVGHPQEAADVALFLASDASAYITGAAIPVDGGYVAR